MLWARMVEQTRGLSYTQILYSSTGSKLALMNGTDPAKSVCSTARRGTGGATIPVDCSTIVTRTGWAAPRLAVKPDRTVYFEVAYAPFGEDYDGQRYQGFVFHRPEPGHGQWSLYDFMFREYSPVQGRWISPDPAGVAAVDITNPQTWNRYPYVANNPLSFLDLLGLSCEDPTDGQPCWVTVPGDPGSVGYVNIGMGPVANPSGIAGGARGSVISRIHPKEIVQKSKRLAIKLAQQLTCGSG